MDESSIIVGEVDEFREVFVHLYEKTRFQFTPDEIQFDEKRPSTQICLSDIRLLTNAHSYFCRLQTHD